MKFFIKKLMIFVTTGGLFIPLFASASELRSELNCDQVIHVDCGKTPSVTMVEGQKLWVVFEQQEHIYFTTSHDLGKSYIPATVVNEIPEKIYTNGENRPKVARGNQGEIYVSWTKKTEGRYTGEIRFSLSLIHI